MIVQSDDWEFTVNGKDVKGSENYFGEVHAAIERSEVIVERSSYEQLFKKYNVKEKKSLNYDNLVCIGFGVKFDEADVINLSGTASSRQAIQSFIVEYSPNKGWSYQSDAPLRREEDNEADVFGFSKKNMVEQFKEVFKKKAECRLRFHRPYTFSRLTKFTHLEYVEGYQNMSNDFIVVNVDSIKMNGEKIFEGKDTKWDLREIINTISALRDTSDEQDAIVIDIHEGCNDEYLRLLLGALDHSNMNHFKLRVIPKKP